MLAGQSQRPVRGICRRIWILDCHSSEKTIFSKFLLAHRGCT